MTERHFSSRTESPAKPALPESLQRLRNAVDRLEAATLYLSTSLPPQEAAGLDREALASDVAECIAALDQLLEARS